jgi:tetratricopeptide (TPR) repeat protein
MQMPAMPASAIDTSPSRRDLYICLVLALVTLALYWPVTGFDFTNYDDPVYILENTHVQSGFTGENIIWAFTSGYASNWHPLTWLSHMLDFQLYGLKPGGHHFSSLLFHVANTLLLFGLLRRMTGAVWRSAFVAALFALHPMHIESVAWVSERKDVLSTFFGLLTLWAWWSYTRTSSRRTYALALLLFACALMSKPMLVTLPILMLLLDYWPFRRLMPGKPPREYWPLVREKLPFFALTIASCVVTIFAQQAGGAVDKERPFEIRAANALVACIRYIAKILWPTNMAVIYPHPEHLPIWQVAGAGFLLAAITLLTLRAASRRPFLAVGWLWFLISLVPVIGLVHVGATAMADRYTYLPAIGLFVMATWEISELLAGWSRGRLVLASAAGLLLVGCFLVSSRQLQYWRNGVTLFSHTLQVTADNAIAHFNLGAALDLAGNHEAARYEYDEALRYTTDYVPMLVGMSSYFERQGKYDRAISCLKEALSVRPDYDQAHYDLGLALSEEGKIDQAIAEYRAAIKCNPRYDKALVNLGATLAQQGRITEAIPLYQQALKYAPDNPYAENALGGALQSQGRLDEAIQHYTSAVQIKPDLVEARQNLALLLARQGRLDEARPHFEAASKLRPDDPELHLELANVLLGTGDAADAATQYTEALKLKPDYLIAHYNLAGLLARQGQLTQAMEHYQEVLKLKPDFAEAHFNVAMILSQEGDDRAAIGHYREALSLKPNFAIAQKNLAWLLATAPDASLRDGAEAVRLAASATQLTPTDPTAWDTFAAAQAEAGQFADAVTSANKALQLANTAHQNDLASQIQMRLQLYQAGKPFRATVAPKVPQ